MFLFDVDNTLLDNDRLQSDLFRHIEREFGAKARARYLAIFEELRSELGYADYLGALERYRLEKLHDPRVLHVANWLVEYPFAARLYPGALEVDTTGANVGARWRYCPMGMRFFSRARWTAPDYGRRLAEMY